MRPLSTLSILVALFFALSMTANIHAVQRVYDNEDFHVDVDSANDLHVTYFSDTKMRLASHFNGPFGAFTASPADTDSVAWICNWTEPFYPHPDTSADSSDTMLYFCDWVHVGVEFEQQVKNYLKKKAIYWTFNGGKVGTDLAGPGFKVTPPVSGSGDPWTYYIINSTSEPLTVSRLQFRISSSVEPLNGMIYPVPGFGELHNNFTLNPNDSVPFVFPDPYEKKGSARYFLMAQGLVMQGVDSTGHFVQQHEHIIEWGLPALTNWGLIILLALLILSAVIVIRNRRKGVARA
ncbi:MAG TPA: hypothetical protein VN285_08410 [Candidatus Deferrimicrobium sp.]|nr:hypothetical protein [Candidatus Deferrimicrobium sp.]